MHLALLRSYTSWSFCSFPPLVHDLISPYSNLVSQTPKDHLCSSVSDMEIERRRGLVTCSRSGGRCRGLGSPKTKASTLSGSPSCSSIFNTGYAISRLYSHDKKKSLRKPNHPWLWFVEPSALWCSELIQLLLNLTKVQTTLPSISLPGPQSVFPGSGIVGTVLKSCHIDPSDSHALILTCIYSLPRLLW